MHVPARVFRLRAPFHAVSARLLLALLAAWALLPAAARAVPITGELSITGTLVLGESTLDFAPAGGGSGAFQVADPSTGSFATLVGSGGTILDLDASSDPVGAALSVASFMTFAGAPNLKVTLTSIEPGVFGSADCTAPPAPGQTCTPSAAGSTYLPALSLVNTSSASSTLSFVVNGTITDTSDGSVSNLTGVVTAQFAGRSYQSALATLLGGGTIPVAYSANFEAVVPEPATAALLALGVAGLALARRRP